MKRIAIGPWVFAVSLVLTFHAFAEDPTNKHAAVEYVLPSWGNGAPVLGITLTGSWTNKLHKGPDFDVHWFSNSLGGSLGIYVGHNPQGIEETSGTTKTNLMVGTKEVAFFVTPGKQGQKMEAVVDDFFKGCSGSGVSELKLHVMVSGDEQGLQVIQQGLKTLKPKRVASQSPEGTR